MSIDPIFSQKNVDIFFKLTSSPELLVQIQNNFSQISPITLHLWLG